MWQFGLGFFAGAGLLSLFWGAWALDMKKNNTARLVQAGRDLREDARRRAKTHED